MERNDRFDDIFSYILNNDTIIENDLNSFKNTNLDSKQSRNTTNEKASTFQVDDQTSATYQSDDTYMKRPSNGDRSVSTSDTKYSNTFNGIELANANDKGAYKLTNIMEIPHTGDDINDFYRQISNSTDNYHNNLHNQHLNNYNTVSINSQHNVMNHLFQSPDHQSLPQVNPLYNIDNNPLNVVPLNQDIPPEQVENSFGNDSVDTNAKYHNHLTEMAIESLKRQRNQSKLIHLDSVPDFQESKDVKIWLQKIFYPLGIEIAIERSDKCKITYKCKALKKNDEAYQKGHVHNSVDDNTNSQDAGKKRRVRSQYNTCPFRIRAAYKIKRKKWEVVILNNSHSHQLKFNPESFNYKQFKDTLREMGDLETIKKFDELEYKAQKNIPVDVDTIPCECGLTEEVQSFGVVLPSSFTGQNKPQNSSVKKFAQKKSNNSNVKLSEEVLAKNLPIPKIKKQSSKSVSTIHSNALENLTRGSSMEKDSCNSNAFDEWENDQQVMITSGNNTVDSSIMGFNSLHAGRSPEAKSGQMFDFNMDINEVDFTELFLKPSKKVDKSIMKSQSDNLTTENLENNDDIAQDMHDLKLFDMTSNDHFL